MVARGWGAALPCKHSLAKSVTSDATDATVTNTIESGIREQYLIQVI